LLLRDNASAFDATRSVYRVELFYINHHYYAPLVSHFIFCDWSEHVRFHSYQFIFATMRKSLAIPVPVHGCSSSEVDISDFCPSYCNYDSPFATIERVLAYVLYDSMRSFRREPPLSTSWMCHRDPVCSSVYFSSATLYVRQEGKAIMDKAAAFVPNSLRENATTWIDRGKCGK
jgi:hypothetical protein